MTEMINYFSKSTGGGRGGKGTQDEGSMLIFLYSMRRLVDMQT